MSKQIVHRSIEYKYRARESSLALQVQDLFDK